MEKYNLILQERIIDKTNRRDLFIKEETDILTGETNLTITPQTASVYHDLMKMLAESGWGKITFQIDGMHTAEIEPSFRTSCTHCMENAEYFFAKTDSGMDIGADHLAKLAANICMHDTKHLHREKEKSRLKKFYDRYIAPMTKADYGRLKTGSQILAETYNDDEVYDENFKSKMCRQFDISEEEYDDITLLILNWKYYSDLYLTIYYKRPSFPA